MKELYYAEGKLFQIRWSLALDLYVGFGLGIHIVRHPPELSYEPRVTPWTGSSLLIGPLTLTLTTWDCKYETQKADR